MRGKLAVVAVLLLALAGCRHEPPAYVSPVTTTASAVARPTFNPAEISRALETVEPYVISVVGDSTGNQPGEWVDLVAQRLAATYNRAVTIHDWSADTYTVERTYGEGAPVTVWNGSEAGKGPDYSLEHYGHLAPENVNLTIVNHSHNTLERSIPQIADLIAAARDNTLPGGGIALVLQNPRTDEFAQRGQSTIDQLRTIYSDPEKGVVVLDVNTAFQERDLSVLLRPDGVHPTEDGSQVWADTVWNGLQL